MRLGGPVFGKWNNPEEWINLLKSEGYRAALSPLSPDASDYEIKLYKDAAKRSDIVIAEVGIWNNVLSSSEKERKENINHAIKSLYLAEKLEARCTVNLTGSRGLKWDGPHDLDYSKETFDMAVDTIRKIIDEVNPKKTFYTVEPMPWMIPDSAESYLKLIKAVNRKSFACHFDPVNMINSPRRYFDNTNFVKDFIKKLGPWIKSCHIKDIILRDKLTVHLDEVICGEGFFDHATCLKELNKLNEDLPILLEHLNSHEEYKKAALYIRRVAERERIPL